ncbi:hypothetical protein KM043_004608 [Ampulex compressa]|nr:hypothetical protein KM043_004608 [Ampulex compressa]
MPHSRQLQKCQISSEGADGIIQSDIHFQRAGLVNARRYLGPRPRGLNFSRSPSTLRHANLIAAHGKSDVAREVIGSKVGFGKRGSRFPDVGHGLAPSTSGSSKSWTFDEGPPGRTCDCLKAPQRCREAFPEIWVMRAQLEFRLVVN